MISGLLFDLDGTLVDTAPDFVRVVNHMLKEDGKATLPFDEIRAQVSNGARALVNLAYGIDEGHPDYAATRQRLLDLYLAGICIDSSLFAGLQNSLELCARHGLPWGIVTNKPRLYAAPLMDALNLRPALASLVCPDDVANRKPHPEPMYKACEEMGADAAQCIYVGDHIRDIEAGRAAGMRTVAAAWGYIAAGDDIQRWGADFIAATPAELYTWLAAQLPPA
ncbi:MAG: HAD-IA family hydrolase [Oceanospirillaceae bacterium]|nr:HAD-IA family hydrolase [Oceanospirillaceae bacterium]MCP5351206.1 HAD-IA family hydrolase [Oceanospirillaceae bacterium]